MAPEKHGALSPDALVDVHVINFNQATASSTKKPLDSIYNAPSV